jgi:hypothetical protein
MKSETWATKARGNNRDEFEIYLSCADDGSGIDFTTGLPLKTFEEWLTS